MLENVIQKWWIIREKLQRIGFEESLPLTAETEFLDAKGQIARQLQPLIHKIGNPQEFRIVIMRFMRRIPSINQIEQLSSSDLRILEKDCHHIYIRLNRWYGEISLE